MIPSGIIVTVTPRMTSVVAIIAAAATINVHRITSGTVPTRAKVAISFPIKLLRFFDGHSVFNHFEFRR